jgi:hypothetical protein
MKNSIMRLAAVLVCLSGSPVFSQPGEGGEQAAAAAANIDIRPAIAAQEKSEKALFKIPGVVAVGSGLTAGGDKPALHMYLNIDNPAASQATIPQQIEGIPVLIFETDEIKALDSGGNHQQDFPLPVPMGVSTGNDNGCFAGTLGFRVFRRGSSSDVGYITNNHVAAAGGTNLCPNKAAFGEDQFQPGLLDSGCSATLPSIGDLVQYVPIVFGDAFLNVVDVAFVKSARTKVNKTILDIGNPSPTVLFPSVGQTVQKSGRMTGFTKGTVQTVNATVSVNYDSSCGTAKFVNQAIIGACCGFGQFSAAGDSGSPVLSFSKDSANRFKPVGLLFAGNSTITVINPLPLVLDSLGVQIDTQ